MVKDNLFVNPSRMIATIDVAPEATVGDFDIVHVHEVGPHYSTTYAILRYQRDPLFIVIEVYNGADGWRLMNIEFNDDAEEVFPASILKPD